MSVEDFLNNPNHDVRIIDKVHKRYIMYDDNVLKEMRKHPENYEIQDRIVIGQGAFFG